MPCHAMPYRYRHRYMSVSSIATNCPERKRIIFLWSCGLTHHAVDFWCLMVLQPYDKGPNELVVVSRFLVIPFVFVGQTFIVRSMETIWPGLCLVNGANRKKGLLRKQTGHNTFFYPLTCHGLCTFTIGTRRRICG